MQQYEGEITGRILEAVQQGHISKEGLATTLEHFGESLTPSEQASTKEALAILQQVG
jgi:hypothetical protein